LHAPLLSVRRLIQLTLAGALTIFLSAWLATADAAAQAAKATTPDKGESTPLNLPTDASPGSSGGGGGGLARTVVGLLVVIAVIYGITWVLKQMKSAREEDVVGSGLETTASLPLGPGRSLHLVRAGTEYHLLGVTDGGIERLRSYTEAEARAADLPIDQVDDDEMKPAPRPGAAGPGAIVERLRDMTVRR